MVGKVGKLLGHRGTLYSAWEVGQSQSGDPTERINQARLDSKPTLLFQLADTLLLSSNGGAEGVIP